MTTESSTKKRQSERDSLLLSTTVCVEGAHSPVTVRVRNLSPGGMMVDSHRLLREGAAVTAELRGIGVVSGTIAWVVEDRAGISFDLEIDPMQARGPAKTAAAKVLFTPPQVRARRPGLKIR